MMQLSITKVGLGCKEVLFCYESKFKYLALLLAYVVSGLALCRGTLWRRLPEVTRDCEFGSDVVLYQGRCRFIYGKWFGKWIAPMKYEESFAYGLNTTKEATND